MSSLGFVAPEYLWLLACIPLVLALPWRDTGWRGSRWRRRAGLLLRATIVGALVCALAGASLSWPVDTTTTMFVVDGSDSMAPAQRAAARRYLDEALGALPAGDRAGIIVFGSDALVERAPGPPRPAGALRSTPLAARTNLADALQLALALLPGDTRQRIVVLSDGGENDGNAFESARMASLRRVHIDTVMLAAQRGADVAIERLSAPGTARDGQQLQISAQLSANHDAAARVAVLIDGRLAAEQAVEIDTTGREVVFTVPAGVGGIRRIEVQVDAASDTIPQNNRAAAFTRVDGPPALLLIASVPARAEPLARALRAAGARATVVPPADVDSSLSALVQYQAVIVVDTAARELPLALLEALPSYVRELGGGFAMTGGRDSFGAGGYRRTALEPMLPIHLDAQDRLDNADVALALVVDRSGSMEERAGGTRTKLDLAREAVYQAATVLATRDIFGLVVFDDRAQWSVPLQPLPTALEIEQALSRISIGGGTNIRAGVALAARDLLAADATVKHMILLSDGISETSYRDLVRDLAAAGVTVSTVAVGDQVDPELAAVAELGGGRTYRATRIDEIPRIFLQETVLAAGRDIVEGELVPSIAIPAPIIRDVDALPRLTGYNGGEARTEARTILTGFDQQPILAQWQVGLGSVVAWTSDMAGEWSADWLAWQGFVRFAGGLVDMLVPPASPAGLALQTSADGGETVFDVTVRDPAGQALDGVRFAARVLDPDDRAATLAFRQVAPGRYLARAPTAAAGVYVLQLTAVDAAGAPLGTLTGGVVVSYAAEYAVRQENPALLRELAALTGGRSDPPAARIAATPAVPLQAVHEMGWWLLWLALLLWPIDIALRRWFPAPGWWRPRPATPVAAAPGATLPQLAAARERAGSRWRRMAAPPSAEVAPPAAEPPIHVPAPVPATTSEPEAPPLSDDERIARLLAARRRARQRHGDS